MEDQVCIYELPCDKTSKMAVRPAKTQISLGIRPVWSESSLSAWRNLGSLATHWAHSKDSDQTGGMPRLIWVFTGPTVTLLVLSWGGSIITLYWNTYLMSYTYMHSFGYYRCMVLLLMTLHEILSSTLSWVWLLHYKTLLRLQTTEMVVFISYKRVIALISGTEYCHLLGYLRMLASLHPSISQLRTIASVLQHPNSGQYSLISVQWPNNTGTV